MPFPLLAHQAPVLPLKLWRPRWFDGTALLIGSLAPDCEAMFAPTPPSGAFGHSWRGQLWFCLPLTLCATWLVARALALPLARRLPHGPPLHLEDLARLATRRSARGWARAVASALVGSASHVALDGATHSGGWLARLVPAFGVRHAMLGTHLSVVRMLQYGVTLVGGIAAAAMLYSVLHTRKLAAWNAPIPALRADATTLGTVALVAGALVGGVLGVVHARPAIAHPTSYFEQARVYVWGYVAFCAFCGAAAGLFAGGAVASALDARAAKRTAAPSPR